MTPLSALPQTASAAPAPHDKLRALAQDLEATFLTEMLKHSGLGETRGSFGGGIGEEQFASMKLQQTAEQLTRSGGIGLAENIFHSLIQRAGQ